MSAYRTVWKFPLDRIVQTIPMPKGATILHVAAQADAPTLWALIEPDVQKFEERTFRVVGTGHDAQVTSEQYLGTCHLPYEGLVLHVFETSASPEAGESR